VAGELPREAHNAPLHLFSASPKLIGFGQGAYRRRSVKTSMLLEQLFDSLQGEGFTMSFTWKDFEREYFKKHFPKLTPQEREEVLRTVPPEERLAGLPPEARLAGLPPEARLAGLPPEARLEGLSVEQIRQYLDQLATGHKPPPRKPRRKK
jgi:hypothetical protein